MADKPITEIEILEAVSDSGYLMEQEVATVFEELGFHVSTNQAYADPDENKSREVDARAYKRIATNPDGHLHASANVICECKNSSNPFFFITRRKTDYDNSYVPQEYLFPIEKFEYTISRDKATKARTYREVDAFHHLGLHKHHHYFTGAEKAVQFGVLLKERNKWVAKHAHIFDSILYPLIKAFIVYSKERRDQMKRMRQNEPPYYAAHFFFPVVVINSPIVCIDSSPTPPTVTYKPYISFVRELKSQTVKGQFMIDFVHKDSIAQYMDEAIKPFTDAIAYLVENDHNKLLKVEVDD